MDVLGSRTPSRFYFTLTSPDGTTVTGATYRGKWLIAGALAQLGRDATRLQPIFITVDPERDTPGVMGSYTEAFDPRIVGFTGGPQQIVAVQQTGGTDSVHHKTGARDEDYVVDPSTDLYIRTPRANSCAA
jgi:protein SCO1/2